MPNPWEGVGPVELPDGRLVCAPHGLAICGKCCVDFDYLWKTTKQLDEDEKGDEDRDFMDLDDDDDEEVFGPIPGLPGATPTSSSSHPSDVRAGTGLRFPTKYIPPGPITPDQLFCGHKRNMTLLRYTLPNDLGVGLIRTDGACLDNGRAEPRAGWAFWHGCKADRSRSRLVVKGRLERKGPFGDDSSQTSNRAELRAVLAALRFRHWPGEGFHMLVIATDSEYVVDGATEWTRKWVTNGWRTSSKERVKNKDMWEALLGEVEKFYERGMVIKFWRIPREWNTVADTAAKEAATEDTVPETFATIIGLNI